MDSKQKGLVERLKDGETVVVAEGYLLEFERRGYLKEGPYVPEVVLERPDLVRIMHEEFVHAGSDVVVAFTYFGHREKMSQANREDETEKLNRTALRIAREVARETGTLCAGDLCHSKIYDPDDPTSILNVEAIFKEQVIWAAEAGVDMIIAESFRYYGEAKLALEAIQQYGNGVPAVITFALYTGEKTLDGLLITEALRKLEEAGAAVVGLNCCLGPSTMLPYLKDIRKAVKGPLAALPICFRTTPEEPTMKSLIDRDIGDAAFPNNLDPFACSRHQISQFTAAARDLGVNYLGLCCGNCAHYTRTLAETLGRNPPSSKYSHE